MAYCTTGYCSTEAVLSQMLKQCQASLNQAKVGKFVFTKFLSKKFLATSSKKVKQGDGKQLELWNVFLYFHGEFPSGGHLSKFSVGVGWGGVEAELQQMIENRHNQIRL